MRPQNPVRFVEGALPVRNEVKYMAAEHGVNRRVG
jgi:hypothetical protein